MSGGRPMVEDPGRVQAHRGARQVAPENTLAAVRAAAAQGARWIEFDVSLLGDGTPVVHHDPTLDRCTDATGPLAALGRDDLARIHAGVLYGEAFAQEPLPTLDAMLDLCAELGLSANLEMKVHDRRVGAVAAAVVPAIASRPWTSGGMLVSSFSNDELTALRAALPEMPLALICNRPPRDWRARLTALRAEALHLRYTYIRERLLAEALSFGFRVRVFTINDPALMAPFRDMGLTGVITDHPPLFLDDPGWAAWARG